MEIADFLRQRRWRWCTLLALTVAACVLAGLSVLRVPVRHQTTTAVDVIAPTGVQTPIADAKTAEAAARALDEAEVRDVLPGAVVSVSGRRDGARLLVTVEATTPEDAAAAIGPATRAALGIAYRDELDRLAGEVAAADGRVAEARTLPVDAGRDRAVAAAEAEAASVVHRRDLATQRRDLLADEAEAAVTPPREIGRMETLVLRVVAGAALGLAVGALVVALGSALGSHRSGAAAAARAGTRRRGVGEHERQVVVVGGEPSG